MIKILAKFFIKDYKEIDRPDIQAKYISLSGYLGLFLNICLVISKLVIGFLSSSIAIISDGFNNLSDSVTSIIAILGMKASSKPADDEHPQGHGRLEYISSLIVSVLVVFVGLELVKASIENIVNSKEFTFSIIQAGVLIISILVKFYMYIYNTGLAKRINSSLNKALALDSLNDVMATSIIFVMSIISKYTGKNLDGYAGLVISILVIKTGYELVKETVSILLGEKPSDEEIEKIENEIRNEKFISSYHDLKVHNYGRGKTLATVHVEVPVEASVIEVHSVIDKVERDVLRKTGIELLIHTDPSYSLREKKEKEGKMQTEILEIWDLEKDRPKLEKAAEIIKNGGLVAIPTETVYGLSANGLDEKAVEKIFIAKGRPQDNPLILHIGDISDLDRLVKEIPEPAREIMDKLWPGPLTLIFKKSDLVPDKVTAGGDTVAIRLPNSEIARELIRLAGVPLAAPSANISGRPSPTNAADVYFDLNSRIDIILDGGATEIGIESTVLDLTVEDGMILRPGFYDIDIISEFLPRVTNDKSLIENGKIPKSPGQKYKHYAPKAEVYIFDEGLSSKLEAMKNMAEEYEEKNKKVGLLVFEENIDYLKPLLVKSLGPKKDLRTMARLIFSQLREMDRLGVDIILVEGVEEKSLGFAIMNRLRKSAAGKIIKN